MSKSIIQITKSAHERLSDLAKQYNSKNIFLSLKIIENNRFSQKSSLFKKYFSI